MEAFRVDRGALGEGRVDHNGTFIVKGILTRTGVFKYRHTDGSTTRELRHPDDVYDSKAVASFAQVPVTDEHPTEGRITPDNSKSLAVGNLGDSLSREGPKQNYVASDLIIRDQATIDKVLGKGGQKPKRFLSCGYKADVIEEAGVFEGERYDRRQTNIRGNHVALVRNPRAGPSATLLLDSEDALIDLDDSDWLDTIHLDNPKNPLSYVNPAKKPEGDNPDDDEGGKKKGKKKDDHYDQFVSDGFSDAIKDKISAKIRLMIGEGEEQDQAIAIAHDMAREGKLGKDSDDLDPEPITQTRGDIVKLKRDAVVIGSGDNEMRLDALVIEVDDDSESALETLLDQRDGLIAYAESQHADAEEARGEATAAMARVQDPKKLDEAARERATILEVADHVGLKRDDLMEVPNAELKKMIVSKYDAGLMHEDASDDFVQGVYGVIVRDAEKVQGNKDKLHKLGDTVASRRTDADKAKPGGSDNNDDDEMTPRQKAEAKLDGVAELDDEAIRQRWAS